MSRADLIDLRASTTTKKRINRRSNYPLIRATIRLIATACPRWELQSVEYATSPKQSRAQFVVLNGN
jgi:hypothetical protein